MTMMSTSEIFGAEGFLVSVVEDVCICWMAVVAARGGGLMAVADCRGGIEKYHFQDAAFSLFSC